MKTLLVAGAAIAALTFAGSASAVTFPGFGSDPNGPGFIITLNADNTASFTATGEHATYDGFQGYYQFYEGDDTYIGVINNSGHSVNRIHLSGNTDIFGFESDGIDVYGATGNALDSSGYGGPNAYFSHITGGCTYYGCSQSGDVNFIVPIANGGSDYFSLEERLSEATFQGDGGGISSGAPEPATWAMMLTGFLGLGATMRRRRAAALTA
ncbi:MAG TPA: PEPxxWA-CTERM sorting domain-containing protein [Phenylobacterium sp.]|jgi:hypothetical protein